MLTLIIILTLHTVNCKFSGGDTTITVFNKCPNFTELAVKEQLESEQHKIVTEDDYVLTVFRIPGDPGRPILLVHGSFDSSDTFIIRGNISLVVYLSAAGYDVWIMNSRGNYYSREHKHLNPDEDKEYWQFSYHEIGVYDIPAVIDYVLRENEREQLVLLAHSNGVASSLIMGSMRPEYNEKVELFVALAPVIDVSHAKGLFNLIMLVTPFVHRFYEEIGLDEYYRKGSLFPTVFSLYCRLLNCYDRLKNWFGEYLISDSEFGEDFFTVLTCHYPNGSSRKNFQHATQNWYTGRFAQYDYGYEKNMAIYKQSVPPLYDLSKATMALVVFYAEDDKLFSESDMKRLKTQVPNVVESFKFERNKFIHAGFIWGKSMVKLLYPKLFQVLNKYTD